jgi:DNA polymerase-3 subunit epsilon
LFWEEWCRRCTTSPVPKTWIDTRLDTPEPMKGTLVCLAAQKGFLNPFPHQALSDVLTMLRILDGYDFNAVIERARIPNVTIRMDVPFESKDHAKELGYYWRPETKQWLKAIKLCDLEKEQTDSRFSVKVVPDPPKTSR